MGGRGRGVPRGGSVYIAPAGPAPPHPRTPGPLRSSPVPGPRLLGRQPRFYSLGAAPPAPRLWTASPPRSGSGPGFGGFLRRLPFLQGLISSQWGDQSSGAGVHGGWSSCFPWSFKGRYWPPNPVSRSAPWTQWDLLGVLRDLPAAGTGCCVTTTCSLLFQAQQLGARGEHPGPAAAPGLPEEVRSWGGAGGGALLVLQGSHSSCPVLPAAIPWLVGKVKRTFPQTELRLPLRSPSSQGAVGCWKPDLPG